MLKCFRPPCTSLAITHETGARWLYQGQTVSWEWQSRQERAKIAQISGGTGGAVYRVWAGSTGGLSRCTGKNCDNTNAAATMRIDCFTHGRTIFRLLLISDEPLHHSPSALRRSLRELSASRTSDEFHDSPRSRPPALPSRVRAWGVRLRPSDPLPV